MQQYLDLLKDILENGTPKDDRTGTGTLSVFGRQMRFNLQEGFPIVTTKRCHLRSIIHELLWFLKGDTNTQYLHENNVTIWDEWQDDRGNLGPVYGKQWRAWEDVKIVGMLEDGNRGGELEKRGYTQHGWVHGEPDDVSWNGERVFSKSIDQISTVMEQLRTDPDSRRIIVSAWNVGDLDDMSLAPCHSFFQFYTRKLNIAERVKLAGRELMRELFVERPNGFPMLSSGDSTQSNWYNEQFDKHGVPGRGLSCMLTQRSADEILGVPFNIASYALLIEMVAQQLNMMPDEFVWSGGDVHLYNNHLEQAKLQLTREPRALPKLIIKRKPESIFDYQYDDFELVGYDPHPAIKAPVAI